MKDLENAEVNILMITRQMDPGTDGRQDFQDSADQAAQTSCSAMGICECRQGHYYVIFDARDSSDSNADAAGDSPAKDWTTHYMLKIIPETGQVQITESGSVSLRLSFQAGAKCVSAYETVYGQIPVEIDVDTLDIEIFCADGEADSGADFLISAEYSLSLEGKHAARYSITIKIEDRRQ